MCGVGGLMICVSPPLWVNRSSSRLLWSTVGDKSVLAGVQAWGSMLQRFSCPLLSLFDIWCLMLDIWCLKLDVWYSMLDADVLNIWYSIWWSCVCAYWWNCVSACAERKLPSFAGRWTSGWRISEVFRVRHLPFWLTPARVVQGLRGPFLPYPANGVTTGGFAFTSRECGWHLEGAQMSPGGVQSSPEWVWFCVIWILVVESEFLWCGFWLWSLNCCLSGDVVCDTLSEVPLMYQGECQEWSINRSSRIIMSLIRLNRDS